MFEAHERQHETVLDEAVVRLLDAAVACSFFQVAPQPIRDVGVVFVEAAVAKVGAADGEEVGSLAAAARRFRAALDALVTMQGSGLLPTPPPRQPVSGWEAFLRHRGAELVASCRGKPDTQSAQQDRIVVAIPLGDIYVPEERRRRANRPLVDSLVRSIRRRGLLSPVRVAHRPADQDLQPYVLVTGLHRYLSHETDGLPTIDALIVEGDPKELELDEIEENLERRDLTVLERARAEKRQKELYLELRPETRAAVAGGRARQGHQAKHVSFAADSATSGSGRRMIEQRVQIATALGDDVFALLADTTIADNHRQLCALARLPVRHRGPAAELIATGKAKTVDAAMQKVTGTPRPPPPPRDVVAKAPLVADATGLVATLCFLGRKVKVRLTSDTKHVELQDEGPAEPVPTYRGDEAEMGAGDLATVVAETIAELPPDIAADFTARVAEVHTHHVGISIDVRNRLGQLGFGAATNVLWEVSWWMDTKAVAPTAITWEPPPSEGRVKCLVRGGRTRGVFRAAFRTFLFAEVLRRSHGITRPIKLAPPGVAAKSPGPAAGTTRRPALVSALKNMGFKPKEATAALEQLGDAVDSAPMESAIRDALAILRR
jgi:ParB family chromosome partitioning protein